MKTTIFLNQVQFDRTEEPIVQHGSLEATTFVYRSGVKAVRLHHVQGYVIVLPYQGQQIWSLHMGGQELKMKSIFDEPRLTKDYLSTYGGFLQHCGMMAMGNPGKNDSHPLHGELPNATYDAAYITAGVDERGRYLEIGGAYRHAIAFTCDYTVSPSVRLYEDATTVQIAMNATNHRSTALPYMYLMHLNFRPVDGSRLVYSASKEPGEAVVYENPHLDPITDPVLLEFIREVNEHPAMLDQIDPAHCLDPEVIMLHPYVADEEGWAHCMQVQPSGMAHYVKHRPEQLDTSVRWMVRTPEEQAMGMMLPATTTPGGYLHESGQGKLRYLASGDTITFQVEAGLLSADETAAMENHVELIMKRKHAKSS